MTKYLTAALAALAVSFSAFAATFHVPPSATVAGSPDGTITWSGVSVGTIVHFRDTNDPPVEYKTNGAMSGSVKLQDAASYGGRFQLRDVNGNWAWLSPGGARFNLVGARLECSHPDGCALEIDMKSRSVPAAAVAPTGVYYGQAATTQVVAPSVAVASAPAYVPPALAATAPAVQPGYKWVMVPVGATNQVTAPPGVKKLVAKKPAAADDCVPGKPIETKDGTVQCINKLLVRIGDAPEALAAMAPAASSAPAKPAEAKK